MRIMAPTLVSFEEDVFKGLRIYVVVEDDEVSDVDRSMHNILLEIDLVGLARQVTDFRSKGNSGVRD